MKLITRQELMKLPNGSIVSEGGKCYADDLFVFEQPIWYDDSENPEKSFYSDFFRAELFPPFTSASFNGCAQGIGNSGRDGGYDFDASYWLWEKEDLELIQAYIKTAIELLNKEKSNESR